VIESQGIYQNTRKEVLNALFAAQQKRQISDDTEQLTVSRQIEPPVPATNPWESLIKLLTERKSLVGKVVGTCQLDKIDNTVVIMINANSRIFVNVILKNRELIESCCREVFGKDTLLDIEEGK
jgi:hypothetical protein